MDLQFIKHATSKQKRRLETQANFAVTYNSYYKGKTLPEVYILIPWKILC